MPTLQSAGVNSTEYDYSGIIPSVATTGGAIAGVFRWGPIEADQLVTSQDALANLYGPPTDDNFETWYTAANYSAYANNLHVTRANSNSFNAIAGPAINANLVSSTYVVKNFNDFAAQGNTVLSGGGNNNYVAKWAGALGNSLKISQCESANQFTSVLQSSNTASLVTFSFTVGSNVAILTAVGPDGPTANLVANTILNQITVGDFIQAGNTVVGTQALKVASKPLATTVNTSTFTATATINLNTIYTLSSNVTQSTATRFWEYFAKVNKAPATTPFVKQRGGVNDEMHVVVVDQDGLFTGVPGEILETWPSLSRAKDAVGQQGGSIYYQNFLNQSSAYVWAVQDRAGSGSANSLTVTGSTQGTPLSLSFVGGSDGFTETTIPLLNLTNAYKVYADKDQIDIGVIMTGKSVGGLNGEQLPNWLIDNIALIRKDLMVALSVNRESVVNNFFAPEQACVNFVSNVRDQSYSMTDSGYKYQYDNFNDLYRYVPLNGDTAGLLANVDQLRDPWWSPAGLNRGFIKNVTKLAFNPSQAQRDILYPANINPVVTMKGIGTILYGDKTNLSAPSAFQHINVRRLFIVLEKAISLAAKYSLFEFNDPFTRAQFVNMVTPYLRDIKGRRGIYDFKVICDESNNPGNVEDLNYFVADIYIKPARSINFIQLNFIATRSDIDFSIYENSSPGI